MHRGTLPPDSHPTAHHSQLPESASPTPSRHYFGHGLQLDN